MRRAWLIGFPRLTRMPSASRRVCVSRFPGPSRRQFQSFPQPSMRRYTHLTKAETRQVQVESDSNDSGHARLSSRRVRLRPIERGDYENLYRSELAESLISRWRHRGATPSPDSWAQNLWLGVLSQFLICPVGLEPAVTQRGWEPANHWANAVGALDRCRRTAATKRGLG